MAQRISIGVAAGLLAAVAAACARPSEVGVPAPADGSCAVGPSAEGAFDPGGGSARPIVVGIPGAMDPANVPAPRTPAERFLFAQLYQTLIATDCEGRPRPLLASAWRAEDDGRRWTFTLRSDARDWEGESVTAAEVASSWIAAQEALAARAEPALRIDFDALTALDARTLRVELPRPTGASFFARPELAVMRRSQAGGWPIGTGHYRPAVMELAPSTGPLAIVALVGAVPLELRAITGDQRDALDRGLDVLVTSDPAAIDYARASPLLTTHPLAWQRRYLLIARAALLPSPADDPDATPAAGGGVETLLVHPPAAALEALARDAVRIAARSVEGAAPWQTCVAAGSPSSASPVSGAISRRIVHEASDAVAGSLASRLAFLASDGSLPGGAWVRASLPEAPAGGTRVSALGFPERAFAEAVRAGRDAAYVLPVHHVAGEDLCASVAQAALMAPWLISPPSRSAMPSSRRGPAVFPLVDAGSTLVIRRGIGGVRVDGWGVLRLEGVGRSAPDGRP